MAKAQAAAAAGAGLKETAVWKGIASRASAVGTFAKANPLAATVTLAVPAAIAYGFGQHRQRALSDEFQRGQQQGNQR